MTNPIFAQQTLDTIDAAVVLNISGYSGASLTIYPGTLAATIFVEQSFDNGQTWVIAYLRATIDGSVSTGLVFTNPNPVNSQTIVLDGGATHVRARVASFTSGAASAVIFATQVTPTQLISYALDTSLAIQPMKSDLSGNLISNSTPSSLIVTGTAASGTGVTITLPAVGNNYHFITFIEITKYFTAANAASATPLVVTTTNLPGSLAFTFGQPLGTIGNTDFKTWTFSNALKSSVSNTATTIVCPATTGIIWRATVYYYTAKWF